MLSGYCLYIIYLLDPDYWLSYIYLFSLNQFINLPEVEKTAKHKWMTAPILQKVDQRRLAKENDALYKLLDREIRHVCIEGNKNLLTEQCQLIEQLDTTNKTIHTHIRLTTGRKCGNGANS